MVLWPFEAVEAQHVSDVHLWKTMDISKFQAALNGGCPVMAQQMSDLGSCNLRLEDRIETRSLHLFSEVFGPDQGVQLPFLESLGARIAWS